MTVQIAGRDISLGLWYDFRNPSQWARPAATLYAETLEHIAYAERLGFDNIWTSEHHFIDDGYSPSLLPLCAAIATRTTRARIGTNVLLLPLHDPVRIAEDAATVDILSNGRFDLGVAAGYKREEFTGMSISRKTRAGRMDEAIEVLRRSWAGGAFSFDGRHYHYSDVNVTPKPVQQPMPLWVGGFSEAAVRRAARVGDGLLAAANVIPTYLDELTRVGKAHQPTRIALSLPWAIVSNDPERDWERYGEHLLYQGKRYAQWFTAAGMDIFDRIPESVREIRDRGADLIVTPSRAAEIANRIVRTLPVTHLYWWATPPGVPPKTLYESMELLARQLFV
jgi:probable F420-dependent oxidoreductase